MDAKTLAIEIEQSVDDFLMTLSKFDNEQLNIVPFPGSWTAGQVADHLRKATDGLPDQHTTAADRDPELYVETLQALFLNFNVKYESPEFIIPDGGPFESGLLIKQFERLKNDNAAVARSNDLSLLCLDFEMPGLGALTRYEWLKFFIAHTQRHAYQLKNIAERILSVKA
jgi:hypothetical protein